MGVLIHKVMAAAHAMSGLRSSYEYCAVTPWRGRAWRGARAYFDFMDALKLLKQDHREVEALFKRFERAGDGATKNRKQIAARVIELLSIHATVEEELFYPAARELSEDL